MYLLQGRTGFVTEIVKQIVEFIAKSVGLCRISMMTTCLLIPNCLIWGGGGYPVCLIGKFRPSVAYYCHESPLHPPTASSVPRYPALCARPCQCTWQCIQQTL